MVWAWQSYQLVETSNQNRSITITRAGHQWDIAMNFTTNDVFSAGSKLHVQIIAWPSPADSYVHKNVTVGFLTAIPDKPTYVRGSVGNIFIPINYSDTRGWYEGSGDIIYQSEGPKCIRIVDPVIEPANETKAALIRFPAECPIDDPVHNIHFPPIINVSPIDVKYQFYANRALVSLGWVVGGLTIVIVREFISTFIRDFDKVWKNRKQKDQCKSTDKKAQT